MQFNFTLDLELKERKKGFNFINKNSTSWVNEKNLSGKSILTNTDKFPTDRIVFDFTSKRDGITFLF